jgi:hypothetical protein
VWNAFYRLVSLVQAVALGGLLPQLLPLVGLRGLSPLEAKLRRIRTDFPSAARRFAMWPSAWWFVGASDRAIVAVGASGVCGALAGLVGAGGAARLGSFAAWASLLSISSAEGLSYPWDCLLFEVSLYKLFLPAPCDSAAAVPPRIVSFALRLLLFRVLVGFGKLKFIPTHWSESAYIKHFVVSLPIPTVLGIGAAQWIPTAAFKLALFVMFVVELPLPFLIFWGGGACHVAAAAGIGALQLGIAATGNFGYFNLLTAVLCLPLLDWSSVGGGADGARSGGVHGGANDGDAAASGGLGAAPSFDALRTALLCVPLACAALHFPLNSWCTQSWLYWPVHARAEHELRKACACSDGKCSFGVGSVAWWILSVGTKCLRALAPFRIAHAFGIFTPHATPPVRYVVTLEGSAWESGAAHAEAAAAAAAAAAPPARKQRASATATGEDDALDEWEEYHWRYQPSHERQRPVFIAPHHPRLDHDVFYWAQGFDNHNMLATLGDKGPYSHCANQRLTRMRRLMQRLLEGESPVQQLLGTNPFPDARGPPLRMRARLWLMRPTPVGEGLRTGRWWRRDAMGAFWDAPHVVKSEPELWKRWPPAPLRWHADSLLWRRSCAPLRVFARAKRSAILAHLAPVEGCASGNPRYLRHFRSLLAQVAALLPAATSAEDVEEEEVLLTWAGLEPIAVRVARRCESAEGRCHVEALREILATLTLLLRDAFEPFYFRRCTPAIDLPRVSRALFPPPPLGEEEGGDGAARGEARAQLLRSESWHLTTTLLAQHVVLLGFAAVRRALLDPAWAIRTLAPHVTMHSGLLLHAALYPRELAAQSAAGRLQRAVPHARGEAQPHSGGVLPGMLDCTTWFAEEPTLRRLCALGVGPSVKIPTFERIGDEWRLVALRQ